VNAIIDERIYTVTGPRGLRRGNLTRVEAEDTARALREEATLAGWSGVYRVVYRDGTVVWAGTVGS
jgi:hypothetical protein